jgi:hypothetical protein
MGRRLRKLVDVDLQSRRNSTRCMARRRNAYPRCTQSTLLRISAPHSGLFSASASAATSFLGLGLKSRHGHHRRAKRTQSWAHWSLALNQHQHPRPFRFDFLLFVCCVISTFTFYNKYPELPVGYKLILLTYTPFTIVRWTLKYIHTTPSFLGSCTYGLCK